ncbi:bestrophin family ion channel [Pantoea cypripedii]|uniref:bestrophin family protein n=1 Tax=Pantoea cypripedii TaxID=55209 RepID=UPI00286F251B|nr:bestrophin family ion channel [Pantoea cypripedii]
MIVRPHQHWFLRLFDWHGSVLTSILFRLSLNLLMSLIAILGFPWYETLGIHLTTAPFSLIGVSIAIFLGFRNNASYARFTEARTLWGTLLITQRSLLRQVKSIPTLSLEQAREFANLQIAFNLSMKHQLRHTDPATDLQRTLPPGFRDQVLSNPLPTTQILLRMGEWLAQQRNEGHISDIVWQSMDENLNHLSTVLGGCDRIASTPIPFAYSLILHRTVYLFCTLLPFALVSDLHAMTPLVSVFISYTFLSLESLAEELEDPFGTAPNDLPLDAICVAIERNLKSMNGDPLPEPLQPDKYFNLT